MLPLRSQLFYLAALMPAAAQATAPAFAPADVFALQWAEAPALSPDGRQIVYQRSFFDNKTDSRRSNLWWLDAKTGEQRPLTSGNSNDTQATWSPDGKRLAYVGVDDGRAQIFLRWMDSGQSARLTQLEYAPSSLSWSPDGRLLAFNQRLPSEASAPAKGMPKPPKDAEWAPPVKVIDELFYRADGSGYVEPGFVHVFVISADGGAPRQVTRGNHNFRGPLAWSADGQALYLSANPVADAEYDPIESDIYRVELDDGKLTRLTERDGPDAQPTISPDGRWLAYIGFDDRLMGYHNRQLSLLDLRNGSTRVLTADFDRSIDSAEWDGNRGLYLQFDDHGDSKIGWISASGGKVQTVASDLGGTSMGRPYAGGSMDVRAGRVAYTRGTAYRPADIAVTTRGKPSRVLTALNDNLLDARTLGKVEEIRWTSSFDQRQVQGWLAYPPDFDPGKKYPLLLEIHGGPFSNYGPRFAPEIQLYAAKGYVVLYCNPRGSTSYGDEFANLIHHNYPGQDYDDLISGVDAVISRGFVDEGNLFVTGGSGGGVLTAWIVGHTQRFQAAVVAKPVINWYSFVLTSDAYAVFSRYWFPGHPWDHQEHYMKRSPISYVKNVTTPTMLISGESDYRTPISEAEQYYQALKLLKVDTALVRVPGASHSINRRPSQMLAQVLNTAGWFEQHRRQEPNAAETNKE